MSDLIRCVRLQTNFLRRNEEPAKAKEVVPQGKLNIIIDLALIYQGLD